MLLFFVLIRNVLCEVVEKYEKERTLIETPNFRALTDKFDVLQSWFSPSLLLDFAKVLRRYCFAF